MSEHVTQPTNDTEIELSKDVAYFKAYGAAAYFTTFCVLFTTLYTAYKTLNGICKIVCRPFRKRTHGRRSRT